MERVFAHNNHGSSTHDNACVIVTHVLNEHSRIEDKSRMSTVRFAVY